MAKRVYLAGPEVFLEDALDIGARKTAICEAQGFEGVFPLDQSLDLTGLSPQEAGLKIYRANRDLMQTCDLTVANMTPFRGPSMDVGTAFEMGYMRALGKPVLGYSNSAMSYVDRIKAFFGGLLIKREGDGALSDPDGLAVEQFELTDNLMLDGAVWDFDKPVVTRQVAMPQRYRDLEAFEACVVLAKDL